MLLPDRIFLSDVFKPWCKNTLARNMICLYSDSIGVFKKHGVVSRCESVLPRRMNDIRAYFLCKAVNLVNICAAMCSKTEVMEAGIELIECVLFCDRWTLFYYDSSSTSNLYRLSS